MIEDAYCHVLNTGHTVVGAMARTGEAVDHAWFCLERGCDAQGIDELGDVA